MRLAFDLPQSLQARFEIVRPLGAGGMGMVFEAIDRQHGIAVALKTLQQLDPRNLFLFKQEFRSLAEISHPNLVPLYELFSDGNSWFFTMELIDDGVGMLDFLLSREVVSPPSKSLPGELSAVAGDTVAIPPAGLITPNFRDVTVTPPDGKSPPTQGDDPSHGDATRRNRPEGAVPSISGTGGGGNGTTTAGGGTDAGVGPNRQGGEIRDQFETPGGDREPVGSVGETVPVFSGVDVTVAARSSPPGEEHTQAQPGPGESQVTPEATLRFGNASAHALPEGHSRDGSREIQSSLPPLDYDRVRQTFLQLARGIQALHDAGKLHRDLKFDNTLVRRRDQSVVILDFGLVAQLGNEWADLESDKSLPPTQTGSGSAEYFSQSRSVVGTLPFMSPEQSAARPITAASDWYSVGVMLFRVLAGRYPFSEKGLELLEIKQIQDAPPPSLWREGIPEDLSQLCSALLQRDPLDRPGGTEILMRLGRGVASVDESSGFRSESRLVGRRELLASLNSSWDRVQRGHSVVFMLDGVSGVGKTAVIEAALADFRRRGAPAIFSGKCYEQETVPYKGFDSLIDSLVRYLARLSVSEQRELLPLSTPALSRIFPVLDQLPAVTCLPAVVAADLLELKEIALQTLKELFCRVAARQPLVLLIDDVQWCDAQSVEMIARLYTGPQPLPAMLITAHRSEYAGGNRLLRDLEALRNQVDGSRVDWLAETVLPLGRAETLQLALRLLPTDLSDREAKADWIVEESGGATLFVYELARHVISGGAMSGTAGVKLDRIIRNRIQKLPEDCRKVLEAIAVAGQPIPYPVALRAAGYQSRSPTLLKRLKSENLVRASDRAQQVDSFHDRVRESLVEGLDPKVRADCHLQIAREWEREEGAEPETLARHFEIGGGLPEAAHYYEAAADRAVESLAFNRAEEFFASASRLSRNHEDRVRIAEKQIHFRSNTTHFHEAYHLGRSALADLGMKVPAAFQPLPLARELLVNLIRMRGRTIASIESLPEMTDVQTRHAVRLLCAMGKAAFQIDPKLCILILAKAANYGLRYGNWPESVIAYMALGCIFYGGILGRHQIGHQYGQLCLNLLDKYQNSQQRPEVQFVVGYFAVAWVRPVAEAEELWLEARNNGRDAGDHFHFGCACCADTLSRFLRGGPLDEVEELGQRWMLELERVGQREPRDAIHSVLVACHSLRSGEAVTGGPDLSLLRDSLEGRMAEFTSRHFAHYFFLIQMIVAYHWRDGEAARRFGAMSGSYLSDSQGMLHHAEHDFYQALVDAQYPPPRRSWFRQGVRSSISRVVRRFRQLAAQCPANFLARLQLLEAESALLADRRRLAVEHWQRAVEQADRQGHWHLKAIACRRLADVAGTDLQGSYLKMAGDAYTIWGAEAVARSLQPPLASKP